MGGQGRRDGASPAGWIMGLRHRPLEGLFIVLHATTKGNIFEPGLRLRTALGIVEILEPVLSEHLIEHATAIGAAKTCFVLLRTLRAAGPEEHCVLIEGGSRRDNLGEEPETGEENRLMQEIYRKAPAPRCSQQRETAYGLQAQHARKEAPGVRYFCDGYSCQNRAEPGEERNEVVGWRHIPREAGPPEGRMVEEWSMHEMR